MILGTNGEKAEMSCNYFEACQRSFYIAQHFNKKFIFSAVTSFVIR